VVDVGFSSDKLTVYTIQPGRGYEQASSILGADFDGLWCGMDGLSTGALPKQCTKRVWRICCGAAAK